MPTTLLYIVHVLCFLFKFFRFDGYEIDTELQEFTSCEEYDKKLKGCMPIRSIQVKKEGSYSSIHVP